MSTPHPIFISYRGTDRAYAGRLWDRLSLEFGADNVFFAKDRDSIDPSSDFPVVLDRAVESAEIVLAMIGPGWLADESLTRLNNDPKDFVRRELHAALQRRARNEALVVVPVMVGGLDMPEADHLPDDLAALPFIQAYALGDDPRFDEDAARLLDLVAIHCPGLRARRQNAWLHSCLTSSEQSWANLGQDIAVRTPERHRIRRNAAHAALDAWWGNWPTNRHAFILLGEEGDGKSWAVADWLADKIEAISFAVPVVVAPAHKLPQASVQHILGVCLEQTLPSSSGTWPTRLQKLMDGTPANTPQFLLVIDALNERPGLPWCELFDTLRVSPWRERVALIGLCRTSYWRELDIPGDGLPFAWMLSPFDDTELDEAIAQRQTSRDQFSPEVLHWMSRPRYFDLAFRLKDQVAQGGLSLDRLIYEDWRDMTGRKQRRACSHEEFLDLVADLARNHERRRITSADFSASALAVTDNVADLLKELTSADILRRQNGSLLFGSRHLPLALGLVLANEVAGSDDQSTAGLREIIAIHMGACAESDLQVRVCAMALFHALNCRDYPECGVLALLRAWIEGRNLDQADLENIAAYLPLKPEIYLRMAEYIWAQANNREVQDSFMRGFLKHQHMEGVAADLKAAFRRWLGFIHPNGFRAWFGPDEAKLAEGRREVERRLGHTATPGPARVLDIGIEIIEDVGLLRLAQVALAVISHDRTQGHEDELLAGLVSATVMDGSQGEFSWVLRTSCAQTLNTLHASALSLLDRGRRGEAIAYLAARKLLMNLGSEEARRLLDEIPEEFRFVHPLAAMRQDNPCNSFGWLWTEENYLDCLERSHKHGSVTARQMKEVALNPENTLPAVYSNLLNEAGEGLDLAQVACQMGNTIENHQLEEIEPALCAFAVSRYRDLMSTLSNQMADRNGLARRMLAFHLLDHFPVLGPDERRTLLAAWRSTLVAAGEHDRLAQMAMFPLVVFDLPAEEQFLRLVERGDANGYIGNHAPCFRALAEVDLPQLLTTIRATEPSARMRLGNLLWYLSKALRQLRSDLRDALLSRFAEFDTVARACCIEIAINTSDHDAARQILAAGWSRQPGRDHFLENEWGSILLAQYGQDIPFGDLVGRIGAEWLGYAIKQRGYLPDEMKRYAQVVDRIWRGIVARTPPPDVLSLSPYVRLTVTNGSDRGEDQLGASDNDPTGVRFANNTWGGSAGTGSFEDLQRAFDTDGRIDRLNTLSRQIADIEEDERSRGNPWFGSSFRHGELDRLLALESTPWREWIGPVLRADDNARRLLILCRGFYEKLCAALMTHSPHEGLALFEVLVSNQNYRIVDGNLDLPFLFLDVFAAPDSPEVEHILREQIDAATNDFELFEFALLCGHGGRANWMPQFAEQWLASDDDYDQARGLTLLGFSNQPGDGERLTDWIANSGDCWLRDLADVASRRYRRNVWAQTWFERFLEREDRSEAWAAFRLFLHCADRRFWLWLDRTRLQQVESWKRDALTMSLGTVGSACRENEKDWKDNFLGQKVKPKELWPWMGDYQ